MPASILAQSAAVMEEVSAALTPSTGLTGDRTVWASGPLAPSPTLFQLLPACQLLHLRLAALELSCKQVRHFHAICVSSWRQQAAADLVSLK